MTGMREKLIELLCKAHNAVTDRCIENGSWSKWGMSYAEQIETEADSLIANGVTIPVRCKDCRHWIERTVDGVDTFHICWFTESLASKNHFCAYGERRTDA